MLYVNLNGFSGKITFSKMYVFRLMTQKQLFSSEPFGIKFWNVFWESMMWNKSSLDNQPMSVYLPFRSEYLNFELHYLTMKLHWEFNTLHCCCVATKTMSWPTESVLSSNPAVVPWQKFCSSRVNPGEHCVSPPLWFERVCGLVGFSGLWGTGSEGCDDSSPLLTKIWAFWGRQR